MAIFEMNGKTGYIHIPKAERIAKEFVEDLKNGEFDDYLIERRSEGRYTSVAEYEKAKEEEELTKKQKQYKEKYGEDTFNDAMEIMDILNDISRAVYDKMYPDVSNKLHRTAWLDGHNAGIAFGISMVTDSPDSKVVKKILEIIKKEKEKKAV